MNILEEDCFLLDNAECDAIFFVHKLKNTEENDSIHFWQCDKEDGKENTSIMAGHGKRDILFIKWWKMINRFSITFGSKCDMTSFIGNDDLLNVGGDANDETFFTIYARNDCNFIDSFSVRDINETSKKWFSEPDVFE